MAECTVPQDSCKDDTVFLLPENCSKSTRNRLGYSQCKVCEKYLLEPPSSADESCTSYNTPPRTIVYATSFETSIIIELQPPGSLCVLSMILLLFFLASALVAQDPFRLAVNVRLMLKGNAAEMAEDVLHLCISVATVRTTEVVDPLDLD